MQNNGDQSWKTLTTASVGITVPEYGCG